jgi:hypothetical protein
MSRWQRIVFGSLSTLAWAYACGGAAVDSTGGNTNWLQYCSEHEQCGDGMLCVCNRCEQSCDTDDECSAPGTGSRCVSNPDPDRCNAVVPLNRVCNRPCTSQADCGRDDLSCSNGSCVVSAGVAPNSERDAAALVEPDLILGPVGPAGPIAPNMNTLPDGGACESPMPRGCGELQGYLEDLPDAGIDIELGTGDLTVLVIFDKSGSMATQWDLRTRWQAASDSMIAGMKPYLDNLTIGAILFPKSAPATPDECGVLPFADPAQIGFTPGHQFVSEWVESACLNQANGGTPMEQAFAAADAALANASELGLLEDRFRVLLVTDGEPNCESNAAELPLYAERWLSNLGVETWVIGLPGSEVAAGLLDSIALAGGTTEHTPASDPCTFQGAVSVAVR